MLLVLSPAKTLAENYSGPAISSVTEPKFWPEAALLASQLQQFSAEQIAELMHISPKLAQLNYRRWHEFPDNYASASCRPAGYLFRGDVYEGLDIDSIGAENTDFMQTHLRILSGLYGLLRPLDNIHPYRLEMGIKLANKRGGNLYEFWGTQIAEALNADAVIAGTDILLNLASQEYAAAINSRALKLRKITVHFKELRGNKLQVIGLFAKRARGQMARFIIQNKLQKPEDIKAFAINGYRFSAELSEADELVFVNAHRDSQ